MDLGIAGRKAIVCASSKGLGRACAEKLAEAGCEVIVNGRSRDTAEATAADIGKATGTKVIAVAADVASPEGQAALFTACPDPDILVTNNLGSPPRDYHDVTRQQILDGVVGSMISPIELIQKAIDAMVAKKFGRIVNITSGGVLMPQVNLEVSCGARAGLTAFLTTVARAVAQHNVTIPASGCVRNRPAARDLRDRRQTRQHHPASGAHNGSPASLPSGSASPRNSARPARFCAPPMPALSPDIIC
jgi:3-oxoacyl-[acyl-carrier protein] reductase